MTLVRSVPAVVAASAMAAALAGCAAWADPPAAERVVIAPGDPRIDPPEFTAYEVEYGSAFGRFTHQVRPYAGPDGDKISILNIIAMPQGVIVDHRGLDRATMRAEYFHSPFFAWGQEYVVGANSADGYDWTRVPLGGGAPQRSQGAWDTGGVFEGLGFSPTLSALMPMEVGAAFAIPRDQPRPDGTVDAALSEFTVVAIESLELQSGLSCECWVLEETDSAGARHRFWVAREAPFLFRRHRDIGGPRDFVSDALSLRSLD